MVTASQVVIIILLVILFLILILQIGKDMVVNQYLFYPSKEFHQTPTVDYKEIVLPNGVVGWSIYQNPAAKTILYCHGNAGNLSFWNNIISLIASQKLNMFIFDYRGFGKSAGITTIQTTMEDGEEAYKYVRQSIEPENIILWGESYGGAVALNIASKHPIGCLTLAGTFSSIGDVLKKYKLPIYINLAAKFINLDNILLIQKVKVPVVIIHSQEDEVIPYSCAEKLFKHVSHSSKQLIKIKGTHASPKITVDDLKWFFDFCLIDTKHCSLAHDHLEKIHRDGRRLFPFSFKE
jgi:pimeloyl-ACP methyl ester carboxylesterase